MKNILLTGFTYYGSYYYNPSEEAIEVFNETIFMKKYRVVGVKLPVSHSRASKLLMRYLEKYKPDLVIGLGLSPRIRELVLELVATNIVHHETPDIDGETKWIEYIEGEELKVLHTRLPYKVILKECRKKRSLPITINTSIGQYLCNHIAYLIHKYSWKKHKIGGFIHIPPHTRLALRNKLTNYQPFNTITDTLKCIIETTLNTMIEEANSYLPKKK